MNPVIAAKRRLGLAIALGGVKRINAAIEGLIVAVRRETDDEYLTIADRMVAKSHKAKTVEECLALVNCSVSIEKKSKSRKSK